MPVEVSVSNTLDSPDAIKLKQSLKEYSNLISDTAIFNTNNNKEDISNLLYEFLQDLYITEPEEVINFSNQKPSKKLIETIFLKYGIDTKTLNNYPDMLKSKTGYLLNSLFENKGTNKAFDLFNEIVSEFYNNLNFYSIRVEQRKIFSKYESPITVSKYKLDVLGIIDSSYGYTQESIPYNFEDSQIEYKVFPTINRPENKVQYRIKFYEKTSTSIVIKLNYTNTYTIPRGVIEYIITEYKYDIYDLSIRTQDELIYTTEPVLINDPSSLITNINPSELRTNKFLMREYDFFNVDKRNRRPTNVFPIITNVLFIQFNNSDTLNPMEHLPDLVRIFAMTKTQNILFSFKAGTTTLKLPLYEYLNILTFLKYRELYISESFEYSNAASISEPNIFSSMIYPEDKLPEIYELLMYYKNMKHDYKQLNEFKRRFNLLVNDNNQVKTTKIFDLVGFSEYLAGNIPNDFNDFFNLLESYYPDNTVIVSGFDQNLILKEEVRKIYDLYKPKDPNELFNIISLQDTEYIKLNNGLYEMLKIHFSTKYPRVVQYIENITEREKIFELYLNSYKRILVETAKLDNIVNYFVNDIFSIYLSGAAFKNEFFDPVMYMFQRYFFKAELSYQNSDAILHTTRDKLNAVVLGDSLSSYNELPFTSEIITYDKYNNTNKLFSSDKQYVSDEWLVQVITEDTVHTYTELEDSVYIN